MLSHPSARCPTAEKRSRSFGRKPTDLFFPIAPSRKQKKKLKITLCVFFAIKKFLKALKSLFCDKKKFLKALKLSVCDKKN